MSLRKLGAIVTWLGGWPAIILLVYGIPGSVDDAGAWYKVINVISNWPILAASIGLVATGPILWTSDWWWTRVVSFAKGRFRESTECSMGMVEDRELEQFRECLPHIKRCRKLIRPYAGTIGNVSIALRVFNDGGDVFMEIATELEHLTNKLSALGIYCPDIWGDDNDSFDKVRFRLRAWGTHLAMLEAKINQNDLVGARFSEPISQPTADK